MESCDNVAIRDCINPKMAKVIEKLKLSFQKHQSFMLMFTKFHVGDVMQIVSISVFLRL